MRRSWHEENIMVIIKGRVADCILNNVFPFLMLASLHEDIMVLHIGENITAKVGVDRIHAWSFKSKRSLYLGYLLDFI